MLHKKKSASIQPKKMAHLAGDGVHTAQEMKQVFQVPLGIGYDFTDEFTFDLLLQTIIFETIDVSLMTKQVYEENLINDIRRSSSIVPDWRRFVRQYVNLWRDCANDMICKTWCYQMLNGNLPSRETWKHINMGQMGISTPIIFAHHFILKYPHLQIAFRPNMLEDPQLVERLSRFLENSITIAHTLIFQNSIMPSVQDLRPKVAHITAELKRNVRPMYDELYD